MIPFFSPSYLSPRRVILGRLNIEVMLNSLRPRNDPSAFPILNSELSPPPLMKVPLHQKSVPFSPIVVEEDIDPLSVGEGEILRPFFIGNFSRIHLLSREILPLASKNASPFLNFFFWFRSYGATDCPLLTEIIPEKYTSFTSFQEVQDSPLNVSPETFSLGGFIIPRGRTLELFFLLLQMWALPYFQTKSPVAIL